MLTAASRIFLVLIWLISSLFSSHAFAAYSMAMGYEPKYPDDFKHFDYADPDAKKGGDLVLEGFPTFDSLNPFLLKGAAAEGVATLMFDTLVESSLDEPFSAYGLLADDFVLADDRLSVTYHINPDAKFSNGNPVLAKDVKFSFETLMGDESIPTYRIYLADIESIEVLDRLSVKFHFRRVNPELHLVVGGIPIFSPDWLEGGDFKSTALKPPIASGPYLVDEFHAGKMIRFKRNKDYWAKDLPVRKGMYNFDSITYKYYKDRNIAFEAMKAGEFDFFDENTSKRWARDHVGANYDSGKILKEEVKHHNNEGSQGFIFNLRRDKFKDIRVRKALALAFDFEWSNKNLFYDQYVRTDSYFSNSEMVARGLPHGKELQLLEKYRELIPDDVFTTEWRPPSTAPPDSIRGNLLKARDLLAEAGWSIKDNRLVNGKGEAFVLNMMLYSRVSEKILAPYAHNLQKLGIELKYRTIDVSLYIKRMETYDFDMVSSRKPMSISPGNELKSYFGSEAAHTRSSKNLAGISDPAVDALIDEVIQADSRADLVIAVRALDRVLLHGEYMVPNWYIDIHRIAYRNIFERPKTLPLYFQADDWVIQTWWMK